MSNTFPASGDAGINKTSGFAHSLEVLGGGIAALGLGPPPAPAVIGAGGTTTWRYYVVGVDQHGNRTIASPAGQTTTGGANLSLNPNNVTVATFSSATSCDLVRENQDGSFSLVHNGTAPFTWTDAGGGTAYGLPPRDSTGDLSGGPLTHVTEFGAKGDGVTDDTAAIQAAVNSLAATGGVLFFPVGTYIINGALNADAGTGKHYGVALSSNVSFRGAGWRSILKLKGGSTSGGVDPQMFFAGQDGSLSNVEFSELAFYGNSANNSLSTTIGDDRNVCAIWIGSNNDGHGVAVDGFRVVRCLFTDWTGASVVLVSDRRTVVSDFFSRDVLIEGNTFWDNRKGDTNRDHSTVNLFADCSRIVENRFALPSTATDLQKQIVAAAELHGSTSVFSGNTVEYYSLGPIFSQNLHHDCHGHAAIGNAMSNMTYRVFDVQVSDAAAYSIDRVVVEGNSVHFNTTPPIVAPYGAPFKWALSFYVIAGKVVRELIFANNSVDGNILDQNPSSLSYVVGVGGLYAGPVGANENLTYLSVNGNSFHRVTYGVWEDDLNLGTVARHTAIVGNRFNDLADITANAKAAGVFMTSNGGPTGMRSVTVAANTFTNDADQATYSYGTYFSDTIFEINIGENWYDDIKIANNGFGALSTAATFRRPNLAAVYAPTYGAIVAIDVGNGDCFDVTATNGAAFTIKNPEINTVTGLIIAPFDLAITIRNASDGALGNVTWDTSYRTSWNNAVDKPANGFSRTVIFRKNPVTGAWVEVSKTASDVPN